MENYKNLIQDHIKDAVNDWIADLKEKQPALLLTRQWQLLFPRGFSPGQNIIPVVSGARKGRHLVAEVLFILPDSLELDMQALELVLKNEPYKEENKVKSSPLPLEHTLDTLNNMISGVNHFLSHLDIFQFPAPTPASKTPRIQQSAMAPAPVLVKQEKPWQDVPPEQLRENIINSRHLPQWFATIADETVKEQLLDSMAAAYSHYANYRPGLTLADFFVQYTQQLKKENKLYPYCPYKAKPVRLNEDGHCLESYCSKKPFRAVCPLTCLKFGSMPDAQST